MLCEPLNDNNTNTQKHDEVFPQFGDLDKLFPTITFLTFSLFLLKQKVKTMQN